MPGTEGREKIIILNTEWQKESDVMVSNTAGLEVVIPSYPYLLNAVIQFLSVTLLPEEYVFYRITRCNEENNHLPGYS